MESQGPLGPKERWQSEVARRDAVKQEIANKARAKLEARRAAKRKEEENVNTNVASRKPAAAPDPTKAPAPTAPDLNPDHWEEAHRFTMMILDKAAVLRGGGNSAPVDALYRSTLEVGLEDFPQWRISVPMLHRDIVLSSEHRTTLSPENVTYLHGKPPEMVPMKPEDSTIACTSVRLW